MYLVRIASLSMEVTHRVKVKVEDLQGWRRQTRSKTCGGGPRVADSTSDLGWQR